jgi:transcriptional regulator with XRE-family HTH domain
MQPPLLSPDALRAAMTAHQVTRTSLCQRAGISPSYLSRILSGKAPVTEPALMERFAAALAVEPERLRSRGLSAAVRIAASPHLWSAPLLNLDDAAPPLFSVLASDQSATGHDSLLALRHGSADLALAFETPLSMTEAADVLTLGSLCAGTDYVRLLVHRASPLLRRIETLLRRELPPPREGDPGDRAAALPRSWQRAPTLSVREETIVGDYLLHLEQNLSGLEEVRTVSADAARPWLDTTGAPIHLILTWEPLAAGIVAASGQHLVDLFAEFDGDLPVRWLPRPVEYQILASRHRSWSPERWRDTVGGLAGAAKAMNHLGRKSRLVLQSQPVIGRLARTLPFALTGAAESIFRRLLAQRLAATRFQLRLWPEVFTSGLV